MGLGRLANRILLGFGYRLIRAEEALWPPQTSQPAPPEVEEATQEALTPTPAVANGATPAISTNFIYIGGGCGIARVRDTGEFVCVDTRSIESLAYLIDEHRGVEVDELAVFRRLLRMDSIVLDIGANFGLYAAVAGAEVGRAGRLWAFEPNPHTFQFLRRTAFANRFVYNDRVRLVNAAVSDHAGTLDFTFTPLELGGAHVMYTSETAPGWQRLSVPAVTIDEVIPPDLAVDLVKIDVEAHEIEVLRGMQQVIARSPNIRIIIEYSRDMQAVIAGAGVLLGFIWELGLRVARIGPLGELIPLARGEAPEQDCYLLLSFEPPETAIPRRISVPLSTLVYPSAGASLRDGHVAYSHPNRSDDAGRILFHGPYMRLDAGSYVLHARGRLSGTLSMRIHCDYSATLLAEREVNAVEEPIAFSLGHRTTTFEVVGLSTRELTGFEIDSIWLDPA